MPQDNGDQNANQNGSEGQNGTGDGTDNQNAGTGDNTGQGAGDANQNDNAGDGDGTTDDADKPVSKADFDKLFARMQAADRRATTAEAKVKEYDDKNKTELERAQEEAKVEREKAATATEKVRSSAIRTAFLLDSSVTWHDPSDALRFADLSDVEVDDEGVVTNPKVIAGAIAKVAKDKPYLVKTTTEASGSGGNSGRKGDDKTPDKAKLAARFPAMNRR